MEVENRAKPLSLREVLGMRPLRRLWMAQSISVFGDFLAMFAVLSHVSFYLHANPAQVTGISIAFMMPFALVGPLAGVFVDRWDVKCTMIASDLLRALLVLLLMLTPSLWQIYAILFSGSSAHWIGIRNTIFLSAALILLITWFGYRYVPTSSPTLQSEAQVADDK